MNGGVLVVGDVIDDVLVRPDGPIAADTDTPSRIRRVPGGSAANTACWLAAGGAAVSLVATVGAEDLDRCTAELERHGVQAHLAADGAAATGSIVVISQGEHRAMLTDRGANLSTTPAQAVPLLASHARLHVTGHVFTGPDRDADWRSLLDRAGEAGLQRSIAPGSAGLLAGYGAARFRDLVRGVEVLVASEDEALLLSGAGDARGAAAALGADHELVAVTLGAHGALLCADGRLLPVPPVAAAVVDVTGAGDAWVAGLLGALAAGHDLLTAGATASSLAAGAVGLLGARPA